MSRARSATAFRPIRLRYLVALVLASGAAACSAGTRATDGIDRQRDLILAEEIAGMQFRNAYDMIRALRPHWLQARGARSLTNEEAREPVVYLDDVRFGSVTALREVLAGDVLEARHLGASEATTRFGTDHAGGAILVRTRRR